MSQTMPRAKNMVKRSSGYESAVRLAVFLTFGLIGVESLAGECKAFIEV